MENEEQRKENEEQRKRIAELEAQVSGSGNSDTQGAEKWSTGEVVAWLEREGLEALTTLAREQELDGPCLFALYDVRMDPNAFKSDCRDLGIPAGAMQIKLKGRLALLFGSAVDVVAT